MINKKQAEKIQQELNALQGEAEHYYKLSERASYWAIQGRNKNTEILKYFWANNARLKAYTIVKKYLSIIEQNNIEKIETETERKQLSKKYRIDDEHELQVLIGSEAIYVYMLHNGYSHGLHASALRAFFNGKTNDYETHTEYAIADLDKEAEHLEHINKLLKDLGEATTKHNKTLEELRKLAMGDYLNDKQAKTIYNYL